MPEGAADGVLRGMYLLKAGGKGNVRAQLFGSGTILREVLAAAALLEERFAVAADIWSVTSFSELRREALDVDRWNARHPLSERRVSYVEKTLANKKGPFVAATDNLKMVADQIRQWVPGRYVVLGTDGFGRSDGREALRAHFEVDRKSIAVAALKALADDGGIDQQTVANAIAELGIDPDKRNPVTA
jgi:pyruvate dehydrogenase E1 component